MACIRAIFWEGGWTFEMDSHTPRPFPFMDGRLHCSRCHLFIEDEDEVCGWDLTHTVEILLRNLSVTIALAASVQRAYDEM